MKKHIRFFAAIAAAVLCLSCFSGCSYYGKPETIAEKAFRASFIDFDASSLSECIPEDAWEKLVDNNGYANKDQALLALQGALYKADEDMLERTDHISYTVDFKISRVDNFTQAKTEALDDDLKNYLYSNIEAAATVYFEYVINVEGNNPFLYWNFSVGKNFTIPTEATNKQTTSLIVIKYNGNWYIDPRIIDKKI